MLKRKIWAALLAVVLMLGLVGCRESGIDDISQNLTQYTIEASYDGDKTVTASMQVRYVNAYDVSLSELKFHLYPAAFREGAKFRPVSERELASAYPQGVIMNLFQQTAIPKISIYLFLHNKIVHNHLHDKHNYHSSEVYK